MAAIADVERLLERIFERSAARLFRTRIQVVQLERRVERAMERARIADGGRTVVPGRYRVRLSPTDLADVAARAGGADALAGRLADAALEFARAHVYHLPDRPMVTLVADPSLANGQVEVLTAPELATAAARAQDRAAGPAEGRVVDDAAATGIRGDESGTQVFRRPAPPAPRAVLRAVAHDGREQTIEVDGTPLTIGRAADNTLVLADGRVSRHHGRLQARRGALVYTDLGSTNGSRVNGIRVDEIVLGQGDRLQVGDSVLVVETLPG
jgi:FhaA, N-terminal domain/FHA domain